MFIFGWGFSHLGVVVVSSVWWFLLSNVVWFVWWFRCFDWVVLRVSGVLRV